MPIEECRESLRKTPGPLERSLLKELFDRGFSALLIVLLSPLIFMVSVALAIEKPLIRDSGGIFYRERRVSLGRDFSLLKFRTVRKSAIEGEQRRGVGSIKHLEKDPRKTTPVGRALCRVYMDELPQLFNVLKGDMSLVGPRPVAKSDHLGMVGNGESCKSLIKPGLTGLVQIRKGSGTGLQPDYEYLCNYRNRGSLGLLIYDLGILMRTVSKILKAEGY